MSDVFEPELNQDFASQDSMDGSVAEYDDAASAQPAEDTTKKDGKFSWGIYNVMLLMSLIFILLATLNMLGVLRTYNEGFPFGGGGFPWKPNL